jgi:predicted DNA-binding transcriptional regulator AlpA
VGRRVNVDDLVGTAEIAARLGVKRPQVVHDWRRRYKDFPEPVARLSQVHVWSWPDVEAWARKTGRLS